MRGVVEHFAGAQLAGRVEGSQVENLLASFAYDDEAGSGGDFDAADVFAFELVEVHAEAGGEVFAEGREEVGEVELEAVAVLFLHQRIIVFEADGVAVVVDTDEQGSSLGVEEAGDGFEDDGFEEGILFVLFEVPAQGRLVLDAGAFACQFRCQASGWRPRPWAGGPSPGWRMRRLREPFSRYYRLGWL